MSSRDSFHALLMTLARVKLVERTYNNGIGWRMNSKIYEDYIKKFVN